MDNKLDEKTIVAISSKTGGAIAMIRLSGNKSLEILIKLSGGKKFDYRVMQKCVIDTSVVLDKSKSILDSCTAVAYEKNKSYTGEQSVEIFCHGSKLIADNIVSACIALGARLAGKGEFTLRAFYNGKMDLSAAEGVVDLIEAENEAAARAAFQLEEGKLFKEILKLQDKLMDIIASVEVNIDYPEEDLDEATSNTVLPALNEILYALKSLRDSYCNGKIISDGVKVVLTGDVNAGKSSLYNALLGFERAIVTDVAGTTRDTIEDRYNYEGVKFVLVDTAGLRQSGDKVEQIGIKRAIDAVKSADIILEVSENGLFKNNGGNVIKVLSKMDLNKDNSAQADIKISVLDQEGIEKLKKLIMQKSGYQTSEELFLTNLRQYECVIESIGQVESALKLIDGNVMDILAGELRVAYKILGKITGLTADSGIVNRIFDRFCVGK